MKNNMKLIQKFLMIVMVMLAWSSITISAKGDKVDDNHLSCDGPYVIYLPDGGVRVVSVTVAGGVKDTTYASLPDNFQRVELCPRLERRRVEAESSEEDLRDV